jgi:lipoate-protein ligase A
VNGSDPAGYSHELNVLIDMNIHHGVIKSVDYSDHVYGADYEAKVRSLLVGRKLQDIGDWHEFLRGHEGTDALAENLSRWLPIPDTPAP